jgi:hypothetical protein
MITCSLATMISSTVNREGSAPDLHNELRDEQPARGSTASELRRVTTLCTQAAAKLELDSATDPELI